MQDNDAALGLTVELISKSPCWKDTVIFVTEDDTQSGLDHVDGYRTLFLAIGPWVKREYVSKTHASLASVFKTINLILGMPPQNLYDAAATDLRDMFTGRPQPVALPLPAHPLRRRGQAELGAADPERGLLGDGRRRGGHAQRHPAEARGCPARSPSRSGPGAPRFADLRKENTMSRALLSGLLAIGSCLLAGASAAQPIEPVATPSAVHAEEQYLVGMVSPRLGSRALATGFGGYDTARESAVLGAAAEMTLTRWLGVRAGFYYVPTGPDNDNVRPNVGLRAQLLRQQDHGIDGAAAFNYRQERYVEDGGLLEAVLSVGRSGDRFTTFANVAYAQDPEADDFEGEVRAAALYRLVPSLGVGLQASYRRDLGSTDQRRDARVQPDDEIIAGPVVTFASGGWVLLLQGGVDSLKQNETSRTGAVAVAGIGTSF